MADTANRRASADSTDDKALERALNRWKLAEDAYHDQIKAELEDLHFVDDPDGQWPSDIRRTRAGQTVGSVVVPARPTLTVDDITPAIDQVLNQANSARLAVKIKPKGSKASQKGADVRQGLYRNIEVESRAHRARMWALAHALKTGRGYYRVLTKFANDGDDDLDIVISRILNQHAVRIDPFHQEPDGSDMEWAFIVEDVPWDRFKRDHPRSELSKVSEDEALVGLGNDHEGWIGGEKEARTVRVAEHYYTKYTTKTRVLTDQGWFDEDDVPAGAERVKIDGKERTREIKVRSVRWQKITCCDVLEDQEIDGRYIPIIQVLGTETNINGTRRYRGMVTKAKDANRMSNVMFSRQMETIGLAADAPWIVAEGQLEGYESQWQQASTLRLPYLTYKPQTSLGKDIGPPQRNVSEPPIAAITQALMTAKDATQRALKTFDPSLGKFQHARQSGRAIAELQQQSEQGNSNFLDNLAQDAMTHEARVVLNLMPFVYDREGRVAQLLGEDDQPQEVLLNQPFVRGQDGRPQPAQPGQPQAEFYDLTEGEYAVTVSIGKSFSTLREESNSMLGQLAQAAPQIVPLISDLWVRSMDFPGKDEIADRLKRAVPPAILGDEAQQDPAALAAQNAQLQQQMQAMQAQLQQSQAKLDVEQLKAESKERIEAAKLESAERIKDMELRLKQMEAIIDANLGERKAQSAETVATLRAGVELEKHEAQLQHADQMADKSFVTQRTLQAEKPSGNGSKV